MDALWEVMLEVELAAETTLQAKKTNNNVNVIKDNLLTVILLFHPINVIIKSVLVQYIKFTN